MCLLKTLLARAVVRRSLFQEQLAIPGHGGHIVGSGVGREAIAFCLVLVAEGVEEGVIGAVATATPELPGDDGGFVDDPAPGDGGVAMEHFPIEGEGEILLESQGSDRGDVEPLSNGPYASIIDRLFHDSNRFDRNDKEKASISVGLPTKQPVCQRLT